ncbi:hypothetical protein HOV93_16400 [Planctomycetes bacterium FF15]|uniref:Uncharacterized protein n=1 Tax=Bremerella alba TaxID=980252 RepID=A0A7V8V4C2_9BACT|nr:hypothetical protein [Bremerella alba]
MSRQFAFKDHYISPAEKGFNGDLSSVNLPVNMQLVVVSEERHGFWMKFVNRVLILACGEIWTRYSYWFSIKPR